MAAVTRSRNKANAVNIGTDRHLFIDHLLVDHSRTLDVTRVMNPPRIIRRIMKREHPWEMGSVGLYASVLDDNGACRMYFMGQGDNLSLVLSLITSEDGLNWERPNLGLVDYNGSKENNILDADCESTVFIDPLAPPERRYKILHPRYWPDKDKAGMYVSWSADGLKWTRSETRLFPFVPDSQNVAFWDDRIGKYVVYMRGWNPERVVLRAEMDDINVPWDYDRSVKPFYVWGEDKVPVPTFEYPTVLGPMEGEPKNLNIYTNASLKYPFAKDVYLAFPGMYFHYKGRDWEGHARGANDGPFEVQMAVSRDGVSWERFPSPYVGLDFYDGIDTRMTTMAVGMVRRGPMIYQYFSAEARTHGAGHIWKADPALKAAWFAKDIAGVFCAAQRVDGFVSMDAGHTGGRLTTKPITFSGNRLNLNINTSAVGSAKVAILDEQSRIIPGFGAKDCVPINGNFIDHEVTWNGGPDLSSLAGRSIRLRLEMRSAKLYAFQFAGQ